MAETTHKSYKISYAAGGAGAIMLGAAQTKPEDAISNLAGWLELFGISNVPSYLATTQADNWVTSIGLAFIAFSALLWSRRRKLPAEVTLCQSSHWMPLHKALHYLVYDTNWAEHQPEPSNKHAFDHVVGDEFLERLARGEINARGRLGWENKLKLSRTSQAIPNEYWTKAFVGPLGEIVLADDDRGIVGRTGEDCFRNVIVDGNAVELVWPKRDNQTNLTPLARYCEPQRIQLKKVKSDE